VPDPVTMHLAPVRQGGPLCVSQAAPSAAAAVQVPVFAPPALHWPFAAQSWVWLLKSPHCPPPDAIVIVVHCLLAALHARP
jgi:hypothetical protein